MSSEKNLTRRCFVKKSLQVAAGIILSETLLAPLESIAAVRKKQPMSFYHTHTGERLQINYSCQGCSAETLTNLNNFLRDFRTGEIHAIDPDLLDILYGIQQQSGSQGVIEIISGYRSPKTNQLLRSRSSGVARNSLHMKGQAVDIRIRDLKTSDLRDVALNLRKGGVGYYGKADFVHIDTGRYRYW
jgi:uncharacterized protein YcbK (DUF882 family)